MSLRTDTQLQAVIGRALVDTEFRSRLVADVRAALASEGYALDDATIASIEEVSRDPVKVDGFTRAFDSELLARADYAA